MGECKVLPKVMQSPPESICTPVDFTQNTCLGLGLGFRLGLGYILCSKKSEFEFFDGIAGMFFSTF